MNNPDDGYKIKSHNGLISIEDYVSKYIANAVLSCLYYVSSFAASIPTIILMALVAWASWDQVFAGIFNASLNFWQILIAMLVIRVVLGPPNVSVMSALTPEEKALLTRFEAATIDGHLRIAPADEDEEDGA